MQATDLSLMRVNSKASFEEIFEICKEMNEMNTVGAYLKRL